jgi:hypothetical protein
VILDAVFEPEPGDLSYDRRDRAFLIGDRARRRVQICSGPTGVVGGEEHPPLITNLSL